MTVTHTAVFPQGLAIGQCICTAAKTTYNDTANTVLLFTAGPNGSDVERIGAMPRGTVSATQLQIYRSPDAGVTMYLVGSALMPAYTMTQTSEVPATLLRHFDSSTLGPENPLHLEAGERLYAAIGVALAAGVVFHAQGVDY